MKKGLLHLAMTIFAVMAITSIAIAQEVIKGTLRSPTGEPLSGATVTIKGTNNSVATNNKGQFSINAPAGSVLMVTYVGYSPKEISINGTDPVVVELQPNQEMQEVVLIGYQSVRRKDLTGSTSIVNTQNTDRITARSLPEQLQGMAAGVSVRTGGQPGQEAVVNIRGLSTFFGNASPLYIIDGMYANPNTTVNPDDVATIQILKDASAAAIYGSRASNGVIIITTKKGKEGPMKISASSKYSFTKIPKRYDMMNGAEYVATNKAAYQAAGYALQPAVANYNGISTNWADEVLRTGSIQDYNLTLSGGSKGSNYLISGSYFNDKGPLIARDFERTALRINTEATRGRFKFGENVMLSSSIRNSPFEGGFEIGNPWYDIWNNLPILPVSDPSLVSTANPGGWSMGSNNARTFSRNLVAITKITSSKSNFFKILGNAYTDFRFTNWLSYRFNLGGETSFDKEKTVRRIGPWYWQQAVQPSSIGENKGQFLSYLFEHTLNFNKKFNKHGFNGVLGYTEQTIKRDYSFAGRANLLQYNGQFFTTLNSASPAQADQRANGFTNETLISSYLGRLNYNFDDRYLATFTFRQDKDSRFSPNYKTAFFPSVALGWNISNERFFKAPWISTLKLRGSYGELGAANLDPYQYTTVLNQGPRTVFGINQIEVPGATQTNLGSPNLRWERKATTNIGLDAGLLNNKLNFSIDAFRSVSKDVLVRLPLPYYLGNIGGDPLVNIGSIENKGIELEAAYRQNRATGFSWGLSGNISVIRNKILALGSLGIDALTGLPRNYIQSGNTRSQIGRSIGEYYVLRTNGIFQSQKEIDDHKAQMKYAKPGDIRYINVIDDGSIDDINDKDRQFAGSPWPKFTTGLQFNSSFKNVSLSIQLYGSFGQKLYNDVIRDLDGMAYSNYRRGINPWSATNTNTNFPRLGVAYASPNPADPAVDQGIISNARGNTDRWIVDGSYLRMRNLELGYQLPKSIISRAHLNEARIFVSGQNLFTITKYSGLDPDVVGANVNLEPGVDNGNYPASRIITLGINLGF